jgi:hypothetical protein
MVVTDNGNGPNRRGQRADPRPRHQMRPVSEMPAEDEDNRLGIAKADFPDGFDLQWVTSEVYGQPQPNHRQRFERRGWEPVHQEDFDSRFDGRFMPAGQQGEIKVEGMVLMARPMEWSRKARQEEELRARQAIAIKEAQLMGGNIEGVKMGGGSTHASALRFNKISRSVEQVAIRVPD